MLESNVQVKEEGWWLVLGDVESQELHALKRFSFAGAISYFRAFDHTHDASPDVVCVDMSFMRSMMYPDAK